MNQEYFERCENYLLDKMSTEERSNFEKELTQNEALRSELEIAKAIHSSAELSVKARLKQELDVIHQTHFDSTKDNVEEFEQASRRNVIPAIVIGLLAVLLIWAAAKMLMNEEPVTQTIYAQNFAVPKLDFTYRGGSTDRFFQLLESSYEEGKYNDFIKQVDDRDSLLTSNPRLMLAKGIAHLEIGEASEARTNFKKLMENAFYRDQANWYIGLSYLKEDDVTNAQKFFKIISRSESRFRDQSIEILKKI
ncbi:MAG: hypothetical protein AAGA77_13020 [Bacteroidota bacterium]